MTQRRPKEKSEDTIYHLIESFPYASFTSSTELYLLIPKTTSYKPSNNQRIRKGKKIKIK